MHELNANASSLSKDGTRVACSQQSSHSQTYCILKTRVILYIFSFFIEEGNIYDMIGTDNTIQNRGNFF
ncbi:MAG TPA: hypothetical protein DEP42_00285 [Ruminococcaceae bacterium]|nr:hypothetical protein [Oscillospiraceae bacterium]